jgi:hypothetical protein
MTISVADIVALKQQIAADRKKLEERENALAIVAEMLRELGGEQPQLDLPVPSKSRTFTEAVRESVHHFPREEFTVANIETLLRGQNVHLNGNPRARIAMIMSDLARKGVIARTFKGSGNTPNRYRLKGGSSAAQ